MRESKKDKREHDYGKVRRFARHIHNDPNIKSYDIKSDLIDELYEKLHVDEKLDYVERENDGKVTKTFSVQTSDEVLNVIATTYSYI